MTPRDVLVAIAFRRRPRAPLVLAEIPRTTTVPCVEVADTASVANRAVEGESGPDPAVCIAISPLRRADLAIKSPGSDLFAL